MPESEGLVFLSSGARLMHQACGRTILPFVSVSERPESKSFVGKVMTRFVMSRSSQWFGLNGHGFCIEQSHIVSLWCGVSGVETLYEKISIRSISVGDISND